MVDEDAGGAEAAVVRAPRQQGSDLGEEGEAVVDFFGGVENEGGARVVGGCGVDGSEVDQPVSVGLQVLVIILVAALGGRQRRV